MRWPWWEIVRGTRPPFAPVVDAEQSSITSLLTVNGVVCRIADVTTHRRLAHVRKDKVSGGTPHMEQQLVAPSLPRLNEPAPDFEAQTTQGVKRLSDYTKAGKWVLLFSHPADFTPVCTTEFMAFSQLAPEFEKRNVQLLGLSVDSVSSHLAWIRDIEENLGVKIPFPVIADLDTKVAQLYGMIHPGASATTARARRLHHRSESRPARHGLLPADHRPQHAGVPARDRRLAGDRQIQRLDAGQLEARRRGYCPGAGLDDALQSEEAKKGEYDYKRWYLRFKKSISRTRPSSQDQRAGRFAGPITCL